MEYRIPSDPTIPPQNNNELLKTFTGYVEYSDGTKYWFQEGKLHREDGPAFEDSDGTKSWWLENKRHRIDGPAREYSDGYKEWWLEGKQYTEEEYIKKIKVLKNLT